jgi:hypothetical protein
MRSIIQFALFMILTASLLSLLRAVPMMVSEREAIRMSMDVLVSQAKIKGMISESDYAEFICVLEAEGVADDVDSIATSANIGERVQKADTISVMAEYHYDIMVPFAGIKRFDAPPIQVESVSHRYWK